MIARSGLVWLAAVLLLVGACGRKNEVDRAGATPKAPAIPVTVAPVTQKDVPVTVTAIGNVQASSTIGVLSQINGQIQRVHFTEGQEVKAGDLLFTIDPRPFEAALQQAQANVARDRAQLAQAQAALAQQEAGVQQAEANRARDEAQQQNTAEWARRYAELADKGFIAREQADQARTNAEALTATVKADEAAIANARASAQAARAAIDNARAAIRADEAAMENARLQLGYTTIRAPMAGRTGNLLIHEGNVVKASDVGNPMVSLTRVRPIHVAFAVAEQFLPDIKRYRDEGTLKVEAVVPNDPEGRSQGTLSFVNNTVDVATGTIQLKATFPNSDNRLWPGQFVNVVLTLTLQRGALVVPSQAIQAGQKGPFVFVVKPDQTVESRPVTVGRALGRETLVDRGLAAGERVVTDGQLKLVPGARVDIKAQPS